MLAAVLCLCAATALAQAAKPLTNDDIVQMVKANFSEETIVKAVEANGGNFDTSVPGLLALKQAGVSEKVINAVLVVSKAKSGSGVAPPANAAGSESPAAAFDVGVYVKEGGKYREMQPEIVNLRTGGMLKALATGGLSGGHINGTIRNPHSPNITGIPAEFVIRCPEGIAITEYQLLRLDEKKDRREFRAMTGGVVHASTGADKNAVVFKFEKIGPATYKIVLSALKQGEYGFLPPGLSSVSAASSGKMYTFGIE